jgi:hypothetical protein
MEVGVGDRLGEPFEETGVELPLEELPDDRLPRPLCFLCLNHSSSSLSSLKRRSLFRLFHHHPMSPMTMTNASAIDPMIRYFGSEALKSLNGAMMWSAGFTLALGDGVVELVET